MHRVVVLALDGVYPFELGIPHRVFGSADGHYEVLTCSIDGESVRSDSDFRISVEHGPEILGSASTVIVPPYDPIELLNRPSELVTEALNLITPGTRVVSICTGAFALAGAGLLDNRPATTHWAQVEEFQAMFPSVALDPNVLFVDDGDVVTSAGAASGIDVCLHLIRKDHGSELANSVARKCVVQPWRDGGQAQFIKSPVPESTSDGAAATRAWAHANLHLPLSLSDLAKHAQMSRRTFTRRFSNEVGVSPGRWLTQQRIARARDLLESTDLPIEDVAARVGFGTAASLRQHLHTAIGIPPLTYRHRFQAGSSPIDTTVAQQNKPHGQAPPN